MSQMFLHCLGHVTLFVSRFSGPDPWLQMSSHPPANQGHGHGHPKKKIDEAKAAQFSGNPRVIKSDMPDEVCRVDSAVVVSLIR